MFRLWKGWIPQRAKNALIATLLSLVSVLTGCEYATQPMQQASPVAGLVTLDGKPIADVAVQMTFGSQPRAIGVTDENGEFRLNIPEQKRDGCIVGLKRVTIMPQSSEKLAKDLPAVYSQFSEYFVEVLPDAENRFEFALKRSPGISKWTNPAMPMKGD